MIKLEKMFELGNLILVLVTYSQTYPQKLWIENRYFFAAKLRS